MLDGTICYGAREDMCDEDVTGMQEGRLGVLRHVKKGREIGQRRDTRQKRGNGINVW